MRFPLRRFLVVSAALIISIGMPTSASGSFPGSNGKIVFFRGGAGTYSISPGGANLKEISELGDVGGVVSPDGSKVAFVQWVEKAGRPHVYVMRIDGSGVRRVSGAVRGNMVQAPVWSPNGRWLAYEDLDVGWDEEAGDEIYSAAIVTVRPNGTDLRKLTGYSSRNGQPSWSPDSQRIVFYRGSGKEGDLWTMDRDGSDKVPITATEGINNYGPAWSPTGTSIAFVRSSADGQSTGVMTIAPDGSNEFAVTDGTHLDLKPTWSPEGTSLAFERMGTEENDLWITQPDGDPSSSVTDDLVPDTSGFAWAPDSTRIVFSAGGNLYVHTLATGTRIKITSGPAYEYLGDWQPKT